MIQRGWVERTGSVRSRGVAYADHVPVFEAAERGDAEAARAAMARHMEGASRRLMEALEQRWAAAVAVGTIPGVRLQAVPGRAEFALDLNPVITD